MHLVFDYVLNTLIIQLSILAFIAPFYGLYRYSHYKNNQVKVNLNTHLEYFLTSKHANYLVFFWALGEALVWFVIPEFLLLLMVFMRIRKRFELLTYDIYGTVVGIIIAVSLNISDASLLKMPYVKENMVLQVQSWFESLGVWGLLYQPFSGVPFKVFNHSMQDYGFPLIAYILIALIVRAGRYALFYFIFNGMYAKIHNSVRDNYVRLWVVATTIFAVLLYEVYTSFGSDYVIK